MRRPLAAVALSLVALAASPLRAEAAERRDLARDERRGGHTLARHVGLSDDDLRERLRREPRIAAASTWTDRRVAEQVVGETLARFADRVARLDPPHRLASEPRPRLPREPPAGSRPLAPPRTIPRRGVHRRGGRPQVAGVGERLLRADRLPGGETVTERYPTLRAFARGYLHEDFEAEHGTPRAALEAFLAAATPAERRALAREAARLDRRIAGWPVARVRDLLAGRARLRVVAGPGERGAGPPRRGDQPFTARLRAGASAAGVTRPRVTSSAPTKVARDRSASPTPVRAASGSIAPHEAAGGASPFANQGSKWTARTSSRLSARCALGSSRPTSWPSWKIGSE